MIPYRWWSFSLSLGAALALAACKPEPVEAPASGDPAPDCEDETDGADGTDGGDGTVDSGDPGPAAGASRAVVWASLALPEGSRSIPWRGASITVEDAEGRAASAALTDVFGVVQLDLRDEGDVALAPGLARVRVEKDGMRLEAEEELSLGENGGHLGGITVALPEGAVAGRLALRDDTPCIWRFPAFDLEGEGSVTVTDAEGVSLAVSDLASDGSFVVAPSSGPLQVVAQCGYETVRADVPREGVEPVWIALQVDNDAPVPRGITSMSGDEPGLIAAVGETLTLRVEAEDEEALSWRWAANAGELRGEGAAARWTMADETEQTVWALGEDGRGGFVLSSFTLRPEGRAERLTLRVMDPDGGPWEGAEVEVDGQIATTDADGLAVLEVLSRPILRGETVLARVRGPGLADARVDLQQLSGDVPIVVQPCEQVSFVAQDGAVLRLPSAPEEMTVTVSAGSLLDASGKPLSGNMTACIARVLPEDGLPVPLRAKAASDGEPRMPAPAALAYIGLSLDADPTQPVTLSSAGMLVSMTEPAALAWPEGTALSSWSLSKDSAVWTTSTAKAERSGGRLNTTASGPGWVTPAPTERWGCVRLWPDRLRLTGRPYMLRLTYTDLFGSVVRRYLPIEDATHQIAPVAANTTLQVDVVDLSVSSPNGPEVPGWTFLLNTGRGRRSDPSLVSMDETCSGDELVLPPSTPAPTGVDFLSRFFIRKGFDSAGNTVSGQDIAAAYYNAADADGSRRTLLSWLNKHSLGGVSPIWAGYTNDYDLGFYRAMRGRSYVGPNGPVVAMIVTNFTSAFLGTAYLNCFQAARLALPVCANLVRGNRSGGTISVAMEYSADNPRDPAYTRFYVYGPDGLLMTGVDLDGRGARAVPGVCMNCHGGQAPGGPAFMDHVSSQRTWPSANVGARFLPFALDSYVFDVLWPSGTSYPSVRNMDRATQEPDFRALNELVLETNLTDAGRRLVHGWYGSSNLGSNSLPAVTQNSHWIPTGAGSTGWDEQPEIYDGVVRPYCRGCHLSFPGLTWENSRMLEQMGYMAQYDLCRQQVMPHALRTWQKMWASDDPHAPGVLLDELPGTGSWNATTCPY